VSRRAVPVTPVSVRGAPPTLLLVSLGLLVVGVSLLMVASPFTLGVSLRRGVCIAGSAGAELGGVTWFRAGGGTSPLSGGVVDCCAQASPIEPNTAMVTAV
jgi:hypothetical protein